LFSNLKETRAKISINQSKFI